MLKRKRVLCGLSVGMMIMAASTAGAATITTNDGVLSIDTPTDAWVQSQDPNYWFVITDGSSSITIDHLSNGEALPTTAIANDQYPEVYQAFVSTLNEVFAVKALSSQTGNLQNLMQIIGTINILKPNTKTAIQTSAAPQTDQFGLRPINAVYYSTGDDVSVRSGCSVDNDRIGSLNRGNQVTVNGAVTLNGADYGWYEIQFNGGKGFVNAGYLSPNAPTSAATTQSQTSSNDDRVQCEYCGEWFAPGNDYRNHVMAAHQEQINQEAEDQKTAVQCEYCGEWFSAGNDYRNHVMAAHQEQINQEAEDQETAVQCEYCGEWFSAGNDYRNHVMAAHSEEEE